MTALDGTAMSGGGVVEPHLPPLGMVHNLRVTKARLGHSTLRQAYRSRWIIKDKIAKDIFMQGIYLLGLCFVACEIIRGL